MGWPYEFVTLSHEEKLLRREALDYYGRIAHYSALSPLLVLLVLRLVRYAVRSVSGASGGSGGGNAEGSASGRGGRGRGRYEQVPPSPLVKAQRMSPGGQLAARWRMLVWWVGDDVVLGGVSWGQRREWIAGGVWMAWLLALSMLGTGKDFLHLTKRFGIIAVSQMPIQYLLSFKAMNLYAWAFASSHEEINRYHRVLGRVIYVLLLLHIIFYNIFLALSGIWLRRFFAPVVFCGVVASIGYHAMVTTSLAWMRVYSYRLFFITHLVTAFVAPVLIFFHANPVRFYTVECVVFFIASLAVRKITAVTAPSVMERIPGTSLVKVSAVMPLKKIQNHQAVPGSHVYVSLPPQGRTSLGASSSIFDVLYNPFSVASVNEEESTITFVARVREGPMTDALSRFALAPQPTSDEHKIPLAIEGPYGSMTQHFNHLMCWGPNRILLIAGGVGATFALPIYQAIQQESSTAKVQLIWAIRGAGDATWAVSGNPSAKSVLDDANIQLFLTGDMGVADDSDNAAGGADDTHDDGVEMDTLYRDRRRGRYTVGHNRRRPNLEKIIDDAFRQRLDDKVAILVCGPEEMTKQARKYVRPWIMRGRDIWWHAESFGW